MDLEITENDKRKRHKKDENKTAKADQCIFSQPVWEQQRRYAVSSTGGTAYTLIRNTENKTKDQMKTLTQTILPRIALYKVLNQSGLSQEDVYRHMRNYMLDIVGTEKHLSMVKMERVPGFYFLYSNIFLRVVRRTDLWDSEQAHGKDYFDVTMKKCLWHTACLENGCEKLCPLFCDVDNVTYGGLKKLDFSRTKTLGYGGDCCDFHFFRKRS